MKVSNRTARQELIRDIKSVIANRLKYRLSCVRFSIEKVNDTFKESKLRIYYDYKAGLHYFTYKGETIRNKNNFKWHGINDFGYFYYDSAKEIVDFLENRAEAEITGNTNIL